ncbi:MAG: DUF4038 domain-containing protein [Bdellovibrionales bacterium]
MGKLTSSRVTIQVRASSQEIFPLSIHSSGRYLQGANGTPFIVVGDSPWSLAVNCTNNQILSYLNDRAAKGCTALLFSAIEKAYSNQTPAHLNVDRVAPFTNMNPVNWVMNENYWKRVDFIVNECKSRGIACFITPAYTGYGNGSDGWRNEYSGATNAALQAYGTALARRYAQGNVVWVLGGDDPNDLGAVGNYGSASTPDRTKQWQIAVGIRSVRTTDLITGHTARNGHTSVDGESYKAWTSGYSGWNLNNIYGHDNTDDAVALATTAYSRPGPLPFFLIEAGYENPDGSNGGGRIPAIQTLLGGGLGGFFGGHDIIWHMGSYSPDNYGAATALSRYLANSWIDYKNLSSLLKAYRWEKLVPQKSTALVVTALGSGSSAICPALATDGSFAFIFTPGANFSVNMAAIQVPSVRARWFDVSAGTFVAISGSPFTNTGTRAFTTPGERILILDKA